MIKLNGTPVEINKFPDGTLLMKQEYSKARLDVIDWRFQNNEELVALIFLTKHLRDSGAEHIDLRMWYIPNARQDRVKKPEDIFTLKYFAQVINSLKFDKVFVLDPHSSVSEALFDNLYRGTPEMLIADVYKKISERVVCDEETVMFYPDEGAMKRYSGMISKPYAFGIKERDWSSGQIKGLSVFGEDVVKGRNVLIVDDISSRGGTFYYSAKKLKEIGAKRIFLFVSHCENTILEGEVLTSGLIERVYTTDSLFTAEHEKIEVIEI